MITAPTKSQASEVEQGWRSILFALAGLGIVVVAVLTTLS